MKSTTDLYFPSSLAKDFPNDELVDQFILTHSVDWIPTSWSVTKIHSWDLGTHPTLPIIQVTFSDSDIICVLIGYLASQVGTILKTGQSLSLSFSTDNTIREFESWLYQHSGRYVAILLGSDYERIYLDPFGSLATVYSPHVETVASTNMLIPYNGVQNDNIPLIQDFGIPATSNSFCLGLTPSKNIFRILPNHYLDLKDWSTVRHWPQEEIPICENPSVSVREISRLLGETVGAFAESYGRVQLPITAGGDSRLLLAASKESWDKIDLYTFDLKPPVNKSDVDIGSAIAKKARLPHTIYCGSIPSENDLRKWIWRNGASANAIIGWKNQHAFKSLNHDYPAFSAVGCEIGRPIVYKDIDTFSDSLDIAVLLKRWRIPINASTLEYGQKWFDNLRTSDILTTMGLFYIENRVGSWAAPVMYSQSDTGRFYINPFSNRQVITLLLSLPRTYRMQENYVMDLIRHKSLGLLFIPFSSESKMTWFSKLLLSGFGRFWCPLKPKGF